MIGRGDPGRSSTGFIVRPDHPLRTGVVARHATGLDTRRYVGIASAPRVARVRVDPAHGRMLTLRVLDGFYVFTLRRGSGQARVTELSASGEPDQELPPATVNVRTRPPYFWPITTWAVRARRS